MKKMNLLLFALIGSSGAESGNNAGEKAAAPDGQPSIVSPTPVPVPDKKEAPAAVVVQSLAREKTTMLVIKGDEIKAKITGVGSSNTFDIKTQGTVFRSRNGKALVIDGKDLPLQCEIKVPSDMQLNVSGGKISLEVNQLKGSMMIEGGNVHCKGKGRFDTTKITAAKLDLDLKGVQKDLSILCGEGKVHVTYDLKNFLDQKKSKGLSLKRPPTINVHLAKGEATFIFPKESELFYRKGIKGLEAEGEPRYKGHDARVFVYIPPQGAKVMLKKEK